jgi:hypothetical protein
LSLAIWPIYVKLLGVIAFLLCTIVAATAEMIPLLRVRPIDIPGDQSSTSRTEAVVSPCQSRLAEVAAFRALPTITGPGDCTATDVVELDAVLLPDKHRVVFSPTATLRRCARSYGRVLVLVSRLCSVMAPTPIMIVTSISIPHVRSRRGARGPPFSLFAPLLKSSF